MNTKGCRQTHNHNLQGIPVIPDYKHGCATKTEICLMDRLNA